MAGLKLPGWIDCSTDFSDFVLTLTYVKAK